MFSSINRILRTWQSRRSAKVSRSTCSFGVDVCLAVLIANSRLQSCQLSAGLFTNRSSMSMISQYSPDTAYGLPLLYCTINAILSAPLLCLHTGKCLTSFLIVQTTSTNVIRMLRSRYSYLNVIIRYFKNYTKFCIVRVTTTIHITCSTRIRYEF